MVAIQIDPGQNNLLPAWRTRGNYTFPVLLMPGADGLEYAHANYGVWAEPTNLLLNRAHKEVFRHVAGAGTALEVEIRELLGLPPFEGLEPATSKPGSQTRIQNSGFFIPSRTPFEF